MTRTELDQFIRKTYKVEAERLFAKNPTTAIYRHPKGRKWFAVIMEVSPKILGLKGTDQITIMNLKIDPVLGDLLKDKASYYPAYHMNKEKWITALIDRNTDHNGLIGLIAMSHRLTKTKQDD